MMEDKNTTINMYGGQLNYVRDNVRIYATQTYKILFQLIVYRPHNYRTNYSPEVPSTALDFLVDAMCQWHMLSTDRSGMQTPPLRCQKSTLQNKYSFCTINMNVMQSVHHSFNKNYFQTLSFPNRKRYVADDMCHYLFCLIHSLPVLIFSQALLLSLDPGKRIESAVPTAVSSLLAV